MNELDYEQLTLFREDSLASHSVLPGSDEARMMTVTSGLKCLELYKKSGPLGSLVRMLLASSTWHSTRRYLTWKVSATPAKRLLFRLVQSMPDTSDIDVQLWPTPKASDAIIGMTARTRGRPIEKSTHLQTQVYLSVPRTDGQLNPDWEEWLMGFPVGWTSL